jgi:hypothetical protein
VLDGGELLVFVAGRSPIRARQMVYWEMGGRI